MDNMNSDGIEVILEKAAFNRRVATYKYKNLHHKDLTTFFNEAETIFVQHAKTLLNKFQGKLFTANCILS